MLAFANERATFYTKGETGTETDPITGEEEPVMGWVPEFENVPVTAEQRNAEYVREVYGEWPAEVYKLYVDPLDIGVKPEAYGEGGYGDFYGVFEAYELRIGPNDRVEFDSVDGRFAIQPPNLQRLDSQIPDHIELEVSKVGL